MDFADELADLRREVGCTRPDLRRKLVDLTDDRQRLCQGGDDLL